VRDDRLAVGGQLRAVVAVARDLRNVLAIEPDDVLAVQVLDDRRVYRAIFKPAGVMVNRLRVVDWPVPHVHVGIGCTVQGEAFGSS